VLVFSLADLQACDKSASLCLQAEVPHEIDADNELTTVGLGNIACGLLTGGGPGTSTLPSSPVS
jgi:MFS superfamily sulfate permease-like transporter